MRKTKCYSVRLLALESISERAYKATDFAGNTAILPKSQVFGQDFDVIKSDAYWISEWILRQKELQYSTKKESWFDQDRADRQADGVTITRVTPETKEPVSVSVPEDLKK